MARAGAYRDRVVFQRRTGSEGRDRFGNRTGAEWETAARLWGNLRETPGKEALAAGRLEATATGTLRTRGTAAARDLTAGDRVLARGHVWSVVAAPIQVDAKGREIEFTLRRGGAEE